MSHAHPNCCMYFIRTYMPISTPQDFFHTMEFSEKVERELDTLQQSAVAYVGAGAREEGEVMGVVSSLRTNSREICEQVRTLLVLIAPHNVVTLHHTPHCHKSHHHTHTFLSLLRLGSWSPLSRPAWPSGPLSWTMPLSSSSGWRGQSAKWTGSMLGQLWRKHKRSATS